MSPRKARRNELARLLDDHVECTDDANFEEQSARSSDGSDDGESLKSFIIDYAEEVGAYISDSLSILTSSVDAENIVTPQARRGAKRSNAVE
jgi:hypothetical protein